MAKAYCPDCKKMLLEVLSSFECLSTWDKAEDYYAPGDECKLVKRCPDCGALARDREAKIERQPIQKTGMENVKPPRFRKRGKTQSKSA